MVGSMNSHRELLIPSSFTFCYLCDLLLAQIASFISRYARITPSLTSNLFSKINHKSNKANLYNSPIKHTTCNLLNPENDIFYKYRKIL